MAPVLAIDKVGEDLKMHVDRMFCQFGSWAGRIRVRAYARTARLAGSDAQGDRESKRP